MLGSIGASLLTGGLLLAVAPAEPPALNPFGQVNRDRDDAIPGFLEMSDGKVTPGAIYMTRDKRLKIYDDEMGRQREIPLRVVQEIECEVKKEWMEKEWRFKELALDEKYYTGREYPAREYVHTITLKDGRKITGALAEVIYVRPYIQSPSGPLSYQPKVEPQRFLFHKRNKGDPDTKLDALLYVKRIKLGEEALEEGRKKKSSGRSSRSRR